MKGIEMHTRHYTRSRRRRAIRSVAVLGVLAVIATACGDDDDSGSAATAIEEAATTTASESATTSGSTDSGPTTTSELASPESSTAADTGEWQEVLDAAGEEGQLLVYSSAVATQAERISTAFEEDFPGIDVEIVTLTSADQVSRLQQERESGADSADVAWNGQIPWFRAEHDAGHLAAPSGPATGEYPQDFMLTPSTPLLYALPIPIQWNTQVVDEPLTGYQDLLRPELQGAIGLGDIDAGASLVGFYDWLRDVEGADIWTKLAGQDPRFYVSPVETAQAVASGELLAAGYASLASSQALVNEGAPIEFVIPSPAFSSTTFASILDTASHPNAAQVFLDWLISEPGQIAIVGDHEAASPINVEGAVAAIEDLFLYRGELTEDESNAVITEWKATMGR